MKNLKIIIVLIMIIIKLVIYIEVIKHTKVTITKKKSNKVILVINLMKMIFNGIVLNVNLNYMK